MAHHRVYYVLARHRVSCMLLAKCRLGFLFGLLTSTSSQVKLIKKEFLKNLLQNAFPIDKQNKKFHHFVFKVSETTNTSDVFVQMLNYIILCTPVCNRLVFMIVSCYIRAPCSLNNKSDSDGGC